MSEPQFQEALDAVVRLASDPNQVPDPASRSDLIENELRAITSAAADLIQQPAREPLEAFFGAARRAVFRLEDAIAEPQPEPGGNTLYCLGKLSALAEMAQTVLTQKVPEPALRVLMKSQVAEEIASALRDGGSMRISDLAHRLDKMAQNLTPVLREMAMVGLVRREEIGRTVRLWPTSLTKAALKVLGEPGAIEPGAVHVESRKPAREVPARGEHRAKEAGETIDPMRAYILDRSTAVGAIGDPDERLRAARRAAEGFPAACGERVDGLFPRGDSQGDVQERDRLVDAFIRCSNYFPGDSELRLFGSEPALYLPGVIRSDARGEIAVRVAEFFDASECLSTKRYMPGPIAAHALARLAELDQAVCIESKRNS